METAHPGDRLADAALARGVEHVEAEAWAVLQVNLPREERERLGVAVKRYEGGVLLLASRSPVLTINRAIGLGFDSPLTPDRLDDVIDLYTAEGIERFIIQLSPFALPADAPQWFAQRGYTIVSHIAKVACPTYAPAVSAATATPFSIREIGHDDALLYERIVADPLGVPEGLGAGVRSAIGQPGWRYYLAYDGDRPIAGGALYTHGEHAWCGLGATLESDRRRGAQTALLTRRLIDAAASRCRWVSADTLVGALPGATQSQRNLERLGFKTLYDRPNYLVDVSGVRSPASKNRRSGQRPAPPIA